MRCEGPKQAETRLTPAGREADEKADLIELVPSGPSGKTAFQRAVKLPDRRIPRPTHGIERQAAFTTTVHRPNG